MNGVIFYNTGIYPKYGYYALDLRTGEQLWYKNGTDNGLKNTVVMTNSYSKGGDSQTFPLLGFRSTIPLLFSERPRSTAVPMDNSRKQLVHA